METPYTNHIKRDEYEFVYEPAEDTFLLLDALEKDLPYIERLSPQICLEIGSGSGVIITALSKRLRNTLCLATDINPYACQVTRRTSSHNQGYVDVVNTNFTQGLRVRNIDLLLFNPPYVVTDTDELNMLSLKIGDAEENITKNQLVRSWAGGKNGREIIDALFKNLDQMLSRRGVLYLLVLKENQPNVIEQNLNSIGFNVENFMDRKIPGEHLYVLKITRKKGKDDE
ncbi:unnamed protein product [Hermetia illucens]|uniref:Methyltransferase HEMK2 n=1 Tax=Hermetia illucens TaxID=343691 RepID=A0A7R8UA46_HERIL|nr:methyltransferase N6AMT1 [Hermetia illucens]CAD7076956.1 unnamed protein product [Hermetia illucens]